MCLKAGKQDRYKYMHVERGIGDTDRRKVCFTSHDDSVKNFPIEFSTVFGRQRRFL